MIKEVMVWECKCGKHSLALSDLDACRAQEDDGTHEVTVGRFVRAESSRDQGVLPTSGKVHRLR